MLSIINILGILRYFKGLYLSYVMNCAHHYHDYHHYHYDLFTTNIIIKLGSVITAKTLFSIFKKGEGGR